MLRRPSLATPSAPSAGTVLPRRGTPRVPAGAMRRRATGRDVPVEQVDPTATPDPRPAAAGVVPRMRRPRGAADEVATGVEVDRPDAAVTAAPSRGASLTARIDHQLALLRQDTPPLRPEAVDDDRARCDPPTASFAAIRAGAAAATGPSAPSGAPARVATPADRPRTAPFPAPSAD